MQEFESFVYLDVEKTGTTFIMAVLNKFCTETKIRGELHKGFDNAYNPTKFHFISIRDPLDQYISLYSFGCEGRGKLAQRLRRNAFGHLYDGTWRGFQRWLDFVLDSRNVRLLADELGQSETGAIGDLVGIQSFRVLRLAMHDACAALGACKTREDIRVAYASNGIVDYVIRNETLRADFAELVRTKLANSFSSLHKTLRYIENKKPRNASSRIDKRENNPHLEDYQELLLREREWPLYEFFGY